MPYQGSSQSIGFRNRTVIDPSKRMRQEAAQIEERGQERIRGMERQASQEIQEMKRVSDLEASNQRYELQALSKFSNTINKFLQEDVVEMVKEDRKEQVARGIEMYASDPQAVRQEQEQVSNAVEQQRALHDKIEAEAQKAPTTEAADRVRSLSKYEQMGWDFAAMREAANGWDSYRESELETNETVLIDSTGTEFVLKDYDRSSLEQYDLAVSHLQTEYIDSHNPKGFSAAVRNTTLTAPILERSARARTQQVQVVNRDRAVAAIDAQENILSAAINGDPGAPDLGKQAITFLESTHKHFETLGAKEGGRKGARTRLATIVKTVIENNNQSEATAERVIEQLKGAKLKGHPGGAKNLFELYQDEFNPDKMIGEAIQADITRTNRQLQARRTPAEAELLDMLRRFPELSPGARVAETSEYINKYPEFTDLHSKANNWDAARLSPERSKEKLAALLELSDGQPVPLSEVRNLDPEVLKQAIDDEEVEEVPFGADAADVIKSSSELVTEAINGAAKLSVDDPLTGAGQILAQKAALNEMMTNARSLVTEAKAEGREITEAKAIAESARQVVRKISLVNDVTAGNKFKDEDSIYWSGTAGGFTNLLATLPDGYVKRQFAQSEAENALKAGRSLREVNITADLPDVRELTPKGTPTSFAVAMAMMEGVTPLEFINAQRALNKQEPLVIDPSAQALQETLDKFPHLKRQLAQDKSPATVSRVLREAGIPHVRDLMRAVGLQESGNRYDEYNDDAHGPEFPALGKYQIMWYNLNSAANKAFGGPGTSWAKELGMPEKATMNGFLRDDRYQERITNAKFNQYIQMAAQQSDDLETIIRMAAAAWYGGAGAMEHWDNPNYGGGEGYPSMQEYTMSVWSRY